MSISRVKQIRWLKFFLIQKGLNDIGNRESIIQSIMSTKRRMFNLIVVGKLVAARPFNVLIGHPCL